MSQDQTRPPSRRRFLETATGLSAVALAGCISDSPSEDPTRSGTDASESTASSTWAVVTASAVTTDDESVWRVIFEGDREDGSFVMSSPAVADGRVFVGVSDGRLRVIGAAEETG